MMIRDLVMVAGAASVLALGACSQNDGAQAHDAGHDCADHDHGVVAGGDHAGEGHGHGPAIELGSAVIAGRVVRASRDQGTISPGGDVAVDAWIGAGEGRVVALRFWIGDEGATGSLKARAQVESPAEGDRWHTHVEVPAPLPAGSRLWIEVELEGAGKTSGSFELEGEPQSQTGSAVLQSDAGESR